MSESSSLTPHHDPNKIDKDPLTYAIGDIPEAANALNQLRQQLLSESVVADLPTPEPEVEDNEDAVQIFPLKDPRAPFEPSDEPSEPRLTSEQQRDIGVLFDLCDEWGNGSQMANVVFSRNSYVAALLKDDEGEVEAVVADTLQENNRMFVWQSRASDTSDWKEVFSGSKNQAHNQEAIRMNHTETLHDRLKDVLTMTDDDLLDRVTKP